MSSLLIVKARRTRSGFANEQPHRQALNPVYNQYFEAQTQDAVERENNALFRPLLIASFVLDSYVRE